MTRVLAAVDDSVAAGPVITAASSIAPLLGSEVEVVHVGERSGHTARGCAEAAGVPFRVLPGDPAARIAELAGTGATAVVVGARNQPPGTEPVGHVALQLAETLTVPLLVVPPRALPAVRVRRVLVAFEGTPHKAKDLRHTLRVVEGADLELVVVHVGGPDDVPSFSDDVAHETADFAREYLARYWPLVPPARLALRFGWPAEEVLAVAAEVEPDLLVAGWPQGCGPGHGRVPRELLRRSPVPVLLVAVQCSDEP